MRILILCVSSLFVSAASNVSAQQNFPDSAEIVFYKAMREINPKYATWIRSTAQQVNDKNLGEADVKQMTTAKWSVLGSMNGQDIEAIAFLVLMQAAKSAQEDLKSIMAHVKSINAQKSKLREVLSSLNDKNQRITRIRLDSVKSLSIQTRSLQRQITPGKFQPERTNVRDSVNPVRTDSPVSKAEIDAAADKVKSDLDSMSEMGEMESLRLQMAMDRMSKMMQTLSNIMKKIHDTANSIIQNMK